MKKKILPFAFFLLLLLLTFSWSKSAMAVCNPVSNWPSGASVGQQAQETVSITVTTSTSEMYGAAYSIIFYNSSNEIIGTQGAAPYGCGISVTFGPYCGVAQASRNIHHAVITNDTPGFALQIDSVVVSRNKDQNASNIGSTNPSLASGVSGNSTLYGSVADMPSGHDEDGIYWRVHLEKGQKLIANGWAKSETTGLGATFDLDIFRDLGSPSAGIAGCAPYGTANFYGEFVNQGEAADFYLRARSLAWKICKFQLKLSTSGSPCPPPYTCLPCPLDSSGNGQGGPGSSFPVQLGIGRERSEFAPDLNIYNPRGPSVTWQRQWLETLALARYGSTGFSPGWSHPYDVTLNSYGNANLQVLFPNGSIQELTALYNQGVLTNEFGVTKGAPYFVRGVPVSTLGNTGHHWQQIEIVWDDGSVWRFLPKEDYRYRLTRITNSVGQNLKFDYDGPDSGTTLDQALQQILVDYPAWLQMVVRFFGTDPVREHRLVAIKNDSDTTLLSLNYRSSDGLLSYVTDNTGRRIHYAWEQPSGVDIPSLKRVSQVFQVGNDTNTYTLDEYDYQGFSKRPLLKRIERVNSNGSGTVVATNNYDSTNARVTSTVDANGNKHAYTYGTGQTTVTISNVSNVVENQWIRYTDSAGRNAGWSNASGHRWYVYYDDPDNPALPTREIDPDGRTTVYTYDAYGHLKTVTSPRGVKITYTWNYSNWRLGRLTQIQKSVGTTTLPATTITYNEPTGSIATITSPHPNGSGTVTTSYSYDSYGNITQVSAPGDANNPTRTTQFFYTQDGTYTQPMVVGRPIAIINPAGKTIHLRYDTHFNLYSITDALGKTTTTIRNYNDQPIRVLLPATGQTGSGQGEIRYTYAYRGGPMTLAQIYNEAGQSVRSFNRYYGAEGELKNSYGNEIAESYQYDSLYRVKKFIDGSSRETTYTYNADGRPSEVTYPNGTVGGSAAYDRQRVTSYSNSGQPLQTIDGRGNVGNYTYNDPDGRLTAISYPTVSYENVAMSYDAFGRLVEVDDHAGREEYTYNSSEKLDSVSTIYQKANFTDMTTWTQSYLYNADGRRNRLATPLGNLDYTYDSAGRLTALKGISGSSTSWNYLDNGWLNHQTLPVNVRSANSRNDAGQPLALTNYRINGTTGSTTEVLSQWGISNDPLNMLSYNASGQILRKVAATTATYDMGGTTTYSYDARAQLSNETSTAGIGFNHSFGYDNAANPTSWKGQTRTFNFDNQETTSSLFDYNGDGTPWKYFNRNITNTSNPSGTSQVLSYNTAGQLRQINEMNSGGTSGNLLAKYGYRGDGKRGWKEGSTGARTYYYYDGDLLLGTSGETANSASILLWGADGLVGTQTKPTSTTYSSSYFLYDIHGNLTQTVGGDGVVYNPVAFTAWGEVIPRSDGSVPNVGLFGYGAKFGYLRDSETGFYLCTYRHYDPRSGRWVTRDPIGYAGGSNLYGYVTNDAANLTDPRGEVPFLIPIAAGFALAGWANIGAQSYNNAGSGKHWFWGLDGGEISIASSIGGATAALTPAATAGTAGSAAWVAGSRMAALGAAANTTQYVLVTGVYKGEKIDCEGLFWAGITGAAGGAVSSAGNALPSTRFMDYWPKHIPLADEPGNAIFRFMGRYATANRNAAMANSQFLGKNIATNPLSNILYNAPQPQNK